MVFLVIEIYDWRNSFINYFFYLVLNFSRLHAAEIAFSFYLINFSIHFPMKWTSQCFRRTASRAFIDFHWIFFIISIQHECSYRIFSLRLFFCDFCFINLISTAMPGEQWKSFHAKLQQKICLKSLKSKILLLLWWLSSWCAYENK